MYEDIRGYLVDGMELQMGVFQGQVVSIDLPQTVELTVVETAPALKNATATAQTKEAVLETGLRLQVPPYLESERTHQGPYAASAVLCPGRGWPFEVVVITPVRLRLIVLHRCSGRH